MSQEIENIRLIGRGIVDRARSDAEFRERMRADPRRTLVAEGLPEEAVPDFLRESDIPGEVEAHKAPGCTVTCTITICDNSCMITTWP